MGENVGKTSLHASTRKTEETYKGLNKTLIKGRIPLHVKKLLITLNKNF